MSEHKYTRTVIVFEPRLLFRHVVKDHFEECGYTVACASGYFLTETANHAFDDNILIAIGIAGSGSECRNILRLARHFSTHGYKVVVWVPERERLLLRLMRALGVYHVLAEERLSEELPGLSQQRPFVTPAANSLNVVGHIKTISPCELNVLLDASRGMSTKQIAIFRHNSYKTVTAHKYNICQRLGLEGNAEWLELLTRIEKIHAQHL